MLGVYSKGKRAWERGNIGIYTRQVTHSSEIFIKRRFYLTEQKCSDILLTDKQKGEMLC